MSIKLSALLPLVAPAKDYKLHLACFNGEDQPLDVFVRSRKEWDGWNTWRGSRNDFTRPYILSFMEFYPEPDVWLYGGTYRVLSRGKPRYEVELEAATEHFIGRLKVRLKRPGRIKSFYLDAYLDQIVVSELLKECYSGQAFPGYERINHTFLEFETIYRNARPDWKAALQSVKGVYLVVDRLNGKKYVGSAYGDTGIWSRWGSYVETGHGWNDELTKLITECGLDYARHNFHFVLLEYRSMKTDDQSIIEREQYWKEALFSRSAFGYNKN